MLNAAFPLLAPVRYQTYLDRYLKDIAEILDSHFACTPSDEVELPGVQSALAEVLKVCYIRSAKIRTSSLQKQRSIADSVEDTYGRCMLHQTLQAIGDAGKARVLLDVLEKSLVQYQATDAGFKISVSLVAAWIVLRVKNSRVTPPKEYFVWPDRKIILQYLEDALARFKEEKIHDYIQGVDLLIGSEDKDKLAATPSDLDQQLSGLVAAGLETAVVHRWLHFRDQLGPKDAPGTIFDSDPNVRRAVVTKFVYYLNAPRFGHRLAADPERIERCTQEALQLVAPPFPIEIHHTLVSTRARAFDSDSELESGADVVSLDAEKASLESDEPIETKRERSLKNLQSTWQAVTRQGLTRDVKLYMLFIEGLGRLGDVAGLQKTWNELVDDEGCKKLYKEEVGDREWG